MTAFGDHCVHPYVPLPMCDSEVTKLLQGKEVQSKGLTPSPPQAVPRLFLGTLPPRPPEGCSPTPGGVSGGQAGPQSPHARSTDGSCAVNSRLLRLWLPAPFAGSLSFQISGEMRP